MKGKQLALLLVVVGVLGAAWFNRSKSSQDGAGAGRNGSKVVEFPLNEVGRVTIKTGSAELNLIRKEDLWTVQERSGYSANFDQISGLLRKLWELKTVQEVKVGESQLARLELVEPGKGESSGALVQLLSNDGKQLAGVLVGKKHLRKSENAALEFGGPSEGFPAGRYIKAVPGSVVSLVSDTLDEIDPTPTRWIATEFVNIDGIKSVNVAGGANWSVSRQEAASEWQLSGAKPDEKLDVSKVSPLSSLLGSSSLADVLAPETNLEPVQTVTVETFEGFKYVLKLGKDEGDNVPVSVEVSAAFLKERKAALDEKPEDKSKLDAEFATKQAQLNEKLAKEKKFEGRVFLLSKSRVEVVFKDRKSLLAEPPPEALKPEVPKPEAPKPEAPKPEAPKPEAPKPEAPKPEAPKPEAPKPEAPKPEAPKPEESKQE